MRPTVPQSVDEWRESRGTNETQRISCSTQNDLLSKRIIRYKQYVRNVIRLRKKFEDERKIVLRFFVPCRASSYKTREHTVCTQQNRRPKWHASVSTAWSLRATVTTDIQTRYSILRSRRGFSVFISLIASRRPTTDFPVQKQLSRCSQCPRLIAAENSFDSFWRDASVKYIEKRHVVFRFDFFQIERRGRESFTRLLNSILPSTQVLRDTCPETNATVGTPVFFYRETKKPMLGSETYILKRLVN